MKIKEKESIAMMEMARALEKKKPNRTKIQQLEDGVVWWKKRAALYHRDFLESLDTSNQNWNMYEMERKDRAEAREELRKERDKHAGDVKEMDNFIRTVAYHLVRNGASVKGDEIKFDGWKVSESNLERDREIANKIVSIGTAEINRRTKEFESLREKQTKRTEEYIKEIAAIDLA